MSAAAAQENLAVHMRWVQARTPGMTVIDYGDLQLSDCGLPTDTFSSICRARMRPAVVRERVRSAVGHFERAGRPFSWWVGPGDEPAGLGVELERTGLVHAESELAMSADLTALDEAPAPPELRIERARTPEAIATFARISAANWSPPDENVVEFYRTATPVLMADGCPLRLYVGYVGETAVATAEATLAGGAAGLYNISTLAAWRRRGFGSALTLAPLLEARAEGCRLAVLQASEAGAGVYRRIGFRETGVYAEYQPPR